MQLGQVRFINLTPHEVNLVSDYGLKINFKVSGQVARLDSSYLKRSLDVTIGEGMELSIPVQEIQELNVYGLPEPEENTIYITSYIVAKYVKRPDVISPLTDATAIRDGETNKVLGVRGFQRFL